MTTARKAAAAKATAARGPARPVTPAAAVRVNILDECGVDGGPPVPITLLGVDAEIRRQFTGDEAATFYQLMLTDRIGDALDLATDNGSALWDVIASLSPEHAAKALNRIVNISGLHEGEPFAPLRWSGSPTQLAGARPSPESSTTTD